MPHFEANPTAKDKAISDHTGAAVFAAMKSFKRRYFDLPQMYIILYNDPTLPPEETARLADEWAESQFKKESQA